MNDHARFIATHNEYQLQRWQDGLLTTAADNVAEEVPVSLVYNGIPHVVMMASPADLEDFALGFSLEQMRQNLKDLERCVAGWTDAVVVANGSNDEDEIRP